MHVYKDRNRGGSSGGKSWGNNNDDDFVNNIDNDGSCDRNDNSSRNNRGNVYDAVVDFYSVHIYDAFISSR